MSRKYPAEFMDESDHEEIYENYSTAPQEDDVVGVWQGKLVSDNTLTPVTQVFTYKKTRWKTKDGICFWWITTRNFKSDHYS